MTDQIKLKFYFKCPKCGRKFEDRHNKEWMAYPKRCPKCDVPNIPEITTFPVKKVSDE